MGNVQQVPAASGQSTASSPKSPPKSPSNSPPNLPNNASEIVPIFSEEEYLKAHDKGDLSEFTAAYDPSTRHEPPTNPFPFQFPLPEIGRITMADRFPKIEDLDIGEFGLK